MKITFEIPTAPRAKGRPRFTVRNGFARAYTPAATEHAEHDVAVLAAQHAPPMPHAGPVVIHLDFYLPIPASWSKRKRAAAIAGDARPISRPDADNIAKLVLDGLSRSGRWWRDDSQIVDLRACKFYGAAPCTRVVVELVGAGQGKREVA